MKTKALFLSAALLFSGLSFAQTTYHAGAGSGTGGGYNVFVGYFTGRITTSQQNSFVGALAGFNNTTGEQNSFLGTNAGNSNTTGGQNTYVGAHAGRFNQFGSNNSFLGYNAGNNNIGERNSFVGSSTGFANTTGFANSFFGFNAGISNTVGYSNSFLGSYAGKSNLSGERNSFVGRDAGYSNTTASDNSFIGAQSGFSNISGTFNSFVGAQSGYSNATGSNNSFMGYQAGFSNTGDRNSFMGFKAGYSNLNGVANCYVGAFAGFSSTGFSNCFIGAYAGQAGTSGTNNSFVGRDAGYGTTTGGYNSILGYAAGSKNTTGSNNLFIGAHANASSSGLTNAGAIGFRAYVTASNALVLGSINGQNGATSDTKVGIRTTAPGYSLHVNGTAAKPGGGTWTVASDKRLKRDISDFNDGLSVLEKIKPVSFRYNGKAGIDTDKQFVGVLAQDMLQIAPYMVGAFTYQDSTGKTEQYLDYDPNALSYILVNSVKELDQKYAKQVESLQAENQTLKQELAQIKQALNRLSPEGNTSVARLDQNRPNPFNQTTLIGYFIPDNTTSAQLKIFSVTGQEVYSQELLQKGEGEVVLSKEILKAGTYLYHLVVDGKRADNKKMVVTH
jgi:hypothetical protein